MTNQVVFPALDSEYPVSAEQQAYYKEKGHICLRDIVSEEDMKPYSDAIIEQMKELSANIAPLEKRNLYGKAFIQRGNLWQINDAAKKFVLAKRFAKIAADLMGVDGVRIYHDQALFKEAGGGITPWHQDQIYWPLDTPNTITMWMPLVPVSQESGTLTFASGTHEMGFISKEVISEESHKSLGAFIEGNGIEQMNYGAMKPGDASFHSGWTAHCAPPNPTSDLRAVMTIIYIADGVKIIEPDSNARKNDLQKWFPGLKPGDIAASEINPLRLQKYHDYS